MYGFTTSLRQLYHTYTFETISEPGKTPKLPPADPASGTYDLIAPSSAIG